MSVQTSSSCSLRKVWAVRISTGMHRHAHSESLKTHRSTDAVVFMCLGTFGSQGMRVVGNFHIQISQSQGEALNPSCAQLLSCVQLFVTPWTVAHQAPLSMGFSRQEYWSGQPFPPPGDLPTCISFVSFIGRQILYHQCHLELFLSNLKKVWMVIECVAPCLRACSGF